MSRIDPKNLVILALLGVLLWPAVRGASARDGGGGDATRDLIAVTGQIGSGVSVLYLVDPKTRHMAVYRVQNGKRIELLAARDCTYDLRLQSLADGSAPALHPGVLQKRWKEFSRGAAVPETTTPPVEEKKKDEEKAGGR